MPETAEDIVERLRYVQADAERIAAAPAFSGDPSTRGVAAIGRLAKDAADEIERLRERIDDMEDQGRELAEQMDRMD